MTRDDLQGPARQRPSEGDSTKEHASELNAFEFMRWTWRQLTSMKTALILLAALAVAAVPGSFIPQLGVDSAAVSQFFEEHPKLAPVLDTLGFFSVYTSVWFSAIYFLLMTSLIGCILPRIKVYVRALRARPPKAPRNLTRLAASDSFETTESPEAVLSAAKKLLGRARVDIVETELRAEKGYLREFGNLLFHISIVFVLVGVAFGSLFSYRGSVIVTEGKGFANALSDYDEFKSGALFDRNSLAPFSFTIDDVVAEFNETGPQFGSPRHFEMTGDVTTSRGATPEPFSIEVNHPLDLEGGTVYLLGTGYSPVIRVTDATGDVVFDDAVPFLPMDATYVSQGVVKVPGAQPQEMAFQGFFLPTEYIADPDEPSTSVFPGPQNPRIGLNMWVGDLGLGDGTPQSVYTLDEENLEQVKDGDKNFRVELGPGQKQALPGGGTIEFVELRQFARLEIASVPLRWFSLIAVCLGLLGVMASLSVRPRRTWVKVRPSDAEPSRTVVEVGAIDRVPRDELPASVDDFVAKLQEELGMAPAEEKVNEA